MVIFIVISGVNITRVMLVMVNECVMFVLVFIRLVDVGVFVVYVVNLVNQS